MGPDISKRLNVIGARVEAAASGPAVIALTSARQTDGTDLLASGLARSLATAGRDVLLVNLGVSCAGAEVRVASRWKSSIDNVRAVRDGRNGEPSLLDLIGAYSLDAARAAFVEFRQRYAFAVVDAPLAHHGGSALSLARAADFVVIAVEQGRSSREDDRELAHALHSAGANTLGVVTIDRKTIRGFQRSAPEARLPVRPANPEIDEAAGRTTPLASRIG
jgi:hypothetical protein